MAAGLSAVPDYRRLLADIYNNLGVNLTDRSKWAESAGGSPGSPTLWERLTTDLPEVPMYQIRLANTHNYNIGVVFHYQTQWAEAESECPGDVAAWRNKW